MFTLEDLVIIISKLNQENLRLVEKFDDACKDFNAWSINLEKELQEKKQNKNLNTDILLSNNNTQSETHNNEIYDPLLFENCKNDTSKKPSRNASKMAALKINQQSQIKLNTKMRRPNEKCENNYVFRDNEIIVNIKLEQNKNNITGKPFTDLTNFETEPHGNSETILHIINGQENKTKTIEQQEINTTNISEVNLKISKTSEVQINNAPSLSNTKSISLHSKSNISKTLQKSVSLKLRNRISPLKTFQNKIKAKQKVSLSKSKLQPDISNQSKITFPLSGNENMKTTPAKQNVDTKLFEKLDEQKHKRKEKQIKAQKVRDNQERTKEEKLKLKLEEKQKRQNILKNKSKLTESLDKHIRRNAVQLVYRNILPHKSYTKRNTKNSKTWLKKTALFSQLKTQKYIPECFIQTLFDMKAKTPDLRKFFKYIQAKKLIRNSSAAWSLSTL